MEPFWLLFTVTMVTKTFILTVIGTDVYLIPIVSRKKVEKNLQVMFYVACHEEDPCTPMMYAPRGKIYTTPLGPRGAFFTPIPIKILARKSKKVLFPSTEQWVRIDVRYGQRVTIIVGYTADRGRVFFNTFSARPLSEAGSTFTITMPVHAKYALVLVVIPSDITRESIEKASGKLNITEMRISARSMLVWDKHDKDLQLEGTTVRSSRALAICIGDRLISGYLTPVNDWGTKFLMLVPFLGAKITLVFYSQTNTMVIGKYKVMARRRQRYWSVKLRRTTDGPAIRKHVYNGVSEIYCDAMDPVGIVFTMHPPHYIPPWHVYPPMATLVPMRSWPQQVNLQIPYDYRPDVNWQRMLLVVASKKDFRRIVVNNFPIGVRIDGKLKELVVNKDYIYGQIFHKETLFFRLRSKKDYKDAHFTVFMYCMLRNTGLYFTQSLKTKWPRIFSRMTEGNLENGDGGGVGSLKYMYLVPVVAMVTSLSVLVAMVIVKRRQQTTTTPKEEEVDSPPALKET